MNSTASSPVVQNIVTLLGVILFCYLVNIYSHITLIAHYIPVSSLLLAQTFERHFWQFVFGFTAIVMLSRGHLWSFGINSKNLKQSMKWLVWLYVAMVSVTFLSRMMDVDLLPIKKEQLPSGIGGTMLILLMYWMSSPVANQILFFGVGQTLLMKQFGDNGKVAGVPLAVYIAAILFSIFGTDSSFAVGNLSSLTTFVVGLFCGIVYWKTGSLITPMLGHAFVFGFPLVIELLSSRIL